MARKTNQKIRKKHLILCEGRDAEEFLIWYLNSEALSDNEHFSNDFQVMDFGGNENLPNFLAILKNMEGFREVESLLVIRDAERDVEKAERQIKAALKKAELSVPQLPHTWQEEGIKVGYLLFPVCEAAASTGTLEDLCLSILSEEGGEEILGEISSFMELLAQKKGRSFPHEFKTRLHTYFSVTDAYVSLKIGEAAKAGAFDGTNARLLPLRNFLEELF